MLDELQLYLNFNASGKVEAHESFHSLLVGVENIDQSFVGPALELLTGILVLVNSAENGNDLFLGRQRDTVESRNTLSRAYHSAP